ncbi:MAG: hypothetical protein H0W88_05475 [Parachlamydiaceae bacterium]|nr:hypothetical protein [Parachlamydiaceae bacterium]
MNFSYRPLSLEGFSHSPYQMINNVALPPSEELDNAVIDMSAYAKELFDEFVPVDIGSKAEDIPPLHKKFSERFHFGNKGKVIENGVKLSFKQAQIIYAIRKIYESFSYQANANMKPSESVEIGLPLIKATLINNQTTPTQITAALLKVPTIFLSEALLNNIFSYLPVKNWRYLITVAKIFSPLHNLLNPILLKKLFKSNPQLFQTIQNPTLARTLIPYSGYRPQKLNQPQERLADKDLRHIAQGGENLVELKLQGGNYTLEGFSELITCCPNLRSIEFNNCNSTEFDSYMAIIAIHGKVIRNIKVIDCAMTDVSLFALSRHGKLESFEYRNNFCDSTLTDYGFLTFLKSVSTTLHTLKISGCPHVSHTPINLFLMGDNDLEQVVDNDNFKSPLVEFSFSYCGYFNAELFNTIARFCPSLKKLELSFNKTDENDSVENRQGLINIFLQCPELDTFAVRDCSFIDTSALNVLLEGHPETLLNLEVSRCVNFFFTSTCMRKITACQHLRSLKYQPATNSVEEIHDRQLQILRKGLTQLESLCLINCQLNGEFFMKFIVTQRLLKSLQLINCRMSAKDLLPKIGRSCISLNSLEIETIEPILFGFNDENISKFVKGCVRVKTLVLKSTCSTDNFTPLTSSSLKALAHCLNLTHLTLSHLDLTSSKDKLTVIRDIRTFINLAKYLIHLGLPGSVLTQDQARVLIRSFPLTSSLDFANTSYTNSTSFFGELVRKERLEYLSLNDSSIPADEFLKVQKLLPALRFADISQKHSPVKLKDFALIQSKDRKVFVQMASKPVNFPEIMQEKIEQPQELKRSYSVKSKKTSVKSESKR